MRKVAAQRTHALTAVFVKVEPASQGRPRDKLAEALDLLAMMRTRCALWRLNTNAHRCQRGLQRLEVDRARGRFLADVAPRPAALASGLPADPKMASRRGF